ncbi:MAG TPA: pyruvate ferredoxin oxidoreductase [Synergistaceae bacterium]|nr:pyruvate ferredoxin oxidoreductase [Synergistaceae bacterium]
MSRREIISGNWAFAEAMRQINPDVVAAYPITPSTDIPMKFSEFVADGKVDTNFVTVESEHSAITACVTAAAAGARVMTASSANGVGLMHEIFPIAGFFRSPIVFGLVNRSLGAPINIHCDHSDSMGERDAGWIHLYCEDAQEAYDTAVMAVRLAEHDNILTPVFVCQDGFITSHGFEPVEMLDDETVKRFVGERNARYPLLDVKNPVTYGSFASTEYYFEIKRQQVEAMENALKLYDGVAREYEAVSGRYYPMLDAYRTEDAEFVVVVMSSAAGVVKDVVDELRDKGVKAGCLRIRMFRPFPFDGVAKALSHAKAIAVLDRSLSLGGTAPVVSEVRSALYRASALIPVQSYVFGLGGRDFFPQNARDIFTDLEKGQIVGEERYIGLLE